jgi:hypothetical protein
MAKSKRTYSDLPGWTFETEEVAQSYWVVEARDAHGLLRVSTSGSGEPQVFEKAACAAVRIMEAA